MSAATIPDGRMGRLPQEVADLRSRVDGGSISALEAAQQAIINPLSLNTSRRRKKRVAPPPQLSMADIWGGPK